MLVAGAVVLGIGNREVGGRGIPEGRGIPDVLTGRLEDGDEDEGSML